MSSFEDIRSQLAASAPIANVPVMTREVTVVGPGGQPRLVRRRVAPFIDQAETLGCDYYHDGGTIQESSGRVRGTHPAGWYLSGYKWALDRPENAPTEEA